MAPEKKVKPDLQRLTEKLARYEQHHLLQFWKELDDQRRARLATQIDAIDFDQVAALVAQTTDSPDWSHFAQQADPPPAIRLGESRFTATGFSEATGFSAQEAQKQAHKALAAGEVGVLLTAGGQGSRLGFESPKGMYPIGPVSGASLLQIHLEKTLALAQRYGASVPVYMMTSPATHEPQVEFLREHNRFGLPEEDLFAFCQGTMPAVDAVTGKLLLAEKDQLFLSPDGHGGTVAALDASGAIDHMRRRGIRHLFYLQIDNPMVPIGDAQFLGCHLLAESQLTSMAVAKQRPEDKVGNFVAMDGRVQVIEYSDFPKEIAEQRNADGSLKFWAGSIAIHLLDVDFLEQSLAHQETLPFHTARKKVSYLDTTGQRVEPVEPNALKFERFIFDLLPHAKNALVLEFAEEEVFAPLKNGPGADRDTEQTVQQFMAAQHVRWLQGAGVQVANDAVVEISPLWALDAQGVAERAEPGMVIDGPTYLQTEYSKCDKPPSKQ